ncbi:glyoxalase superfamily protein [Acinetobacter courvalinii]|uniref:glyoxalase superfamily protein n=1 Tax=Acinetobacter courvalinii TaxID=280147 RepID=UPI001902B382|nr:glyoxalase superfamily protein [Acinetobacter courvalinii]MBJ9957103.1 glyoxalase/bleomycin resistance/extradiol dioxygenase family protein [Acinetobacter courvalinii]MCU4639682.1 glyoxalase/bleomycin resistance/extradiol dioxygenase family protein [Acinetobacter courvalinii]
MQSGSITPILRIFDVELAQSFYLEYLGFQLDWQHSFGDNFPLYLQISREDCIIHLTEHFGDASPHSAIRIYWENLSLLHAELDAKDYKFAKPQVEKTDWETLELSISDPFSNRIIFWEDA